MKTELETKKIEKNLADSKISSTFAKRKQSAG
jgi:hypothetical protein